MKTCSRCLIEKPDDEFYRDRRRPDGLYSACKACHVATVRAPVRESDEARERRLAHGRARAKANPEANVARVRRWRLRHPDAAREQDAAYKQLARSGNDTRGRVLARDGRCLACGATEDLCVDHIEPVSRGGHNDLRNLQTLCRSCNSTKRLKATDFRPRAES